MGPLRGIVIAVDARRRSPGFWIQSATDDGDSATAQGLRVNTAQPTDLVLGDEVEVRGRIEEIGSRGELSTTALVAASWTRLTSGRPLPAPVILGETGRRIPQGHIDDDGLRAFEPDDDAADFFESLEGMRVEIHDALVVGATSPFGEVVVVADRGAETAPRSWRGGVLAASGDTNPERIVLDFSLLRQRSQAKVGDVYAGAVVGVLDYDFGLYRVLLTSDPPEPQKSRVRRDRSSLRGDARHLSIASYNVLNLGADDEEHVFRGLARSLVEDLGTPDVVALQEIQDASGERDDGVVAGAPTLAKLTAAIQRLGGPAYEYLQIDPGDKQDGGAPGGNIRVALLVDPTRVEVIRRGRPGDEVDVLGAAEPRLSASPGRIGPSDPAFRHSRKPLAVELRFNGSTLFVANCHLESKRGDDPLFGSVQPPERPSEARRRLQAESVARTVREILSVDPNARVIVLGDLNEHEFRSPLLPLTEAGLENLVLRVPLPERYTYNFRGSSQVLDHIWVSPALVADAEVDIVHVNADFPSRGRLSDHDPILARLSMSPP